MMFSEQNPRRYQDEAFLLGNQYAGIKSRTMEKSLCFHSKPLLSANVAYVLMHLSSLAEMLPNERFGWGIAENSIRKCYPHTNER